MQKRVVATEDAPAAVGPYSQAIQAGAFVFAAGQLGLDPTTKEFAGGDVAAQTRQALKNVEAVLKAAGSSLAQVLKTTVFLADMGDFGAMNAVYAEFFKGAPPARSTVQAGALPLGGLVEIEAIALVS